MKWKPSVGSRLAALALVVVVVPAVILAVVQYRTLADWQSKTEVAVREALRQNLSQFAQRVEESLARRAREVVAKLDTRQLAAKQGDELSLLFDQFKQTLPEAENVLAVLYQRGRSKDFAVHYGPQGARRIQARDLCEDDLAGRAITLEERIRSLARFDSRDDQTVFWQESSPLWGCRSNGLASYVVTPMEKRSKGASAFALIDLSKERIGRDLLQSLMADFGPLNIEGAKPVLTVLDERGIVVASSSPVQGSREVSMPFEPAFPQWTLAIGYQDASINALARQGFRTNLLLVALALGTLVFGTALTLRAGTREAGLAQAKSNFVSNVSHELKTPLSLIRLFSETLEMERVKTPAKIRDYHRIIHRESRRLGQLIDNILDFSKIEAKKRTYRFHSMDVAHPVREVLENYSYQLENAGFRLKVELEEGLTARIDSEAISRAVLNLLDNAVKYSPQDRSIAVKVKKQGEWAAIEIADQGIGIPRSLQGKVFEKFFRAGSDLVHETRGSGLGLALVRHIVEAHGGRIRLESAPGRGSRFTVLIPLQRGETHRIEAPLLVGHEIAENPHH